MQMSLRTFNVNKLGLQPHQYRLGPYIFLEHDEVDSFVYNHRLEPSTAMAAVVEVASMSRNHLYYPVP